MKINSHVIFLIAIVGIIAAGVVGATLLNNGSMKQVDFDGIKVNVPSDSNFVKTADGYADSKYGITIHTFKNNDSMVNFLKGVTGASVISLKNQPPQSVAFVQGDNTNVLLTNGVEGISIGAKDQGLVIDMSNSVVFSNHQKSVKPKISVPGITPPPHMEVNIDFNLILPLIAKVNSTEFNPGNVTPILNNTSDSFNNASNNGNLDNYTAPNNSHISTTGSPVANNNQQNTSLLDNLQASNVLQLASISGDTASNNANPSSNPTSSAFPSSSVSSNAGNSPSGDSSQQQKITISDFKNALMQSFHNGEKIVDVNESGDYYIVKVKYTDGQTEKFEYNAFTGEFIRKL